MIFVSCGTQDKEFRRLFEEVERLVDIGKITDKVIAQIGNTKFVSESWRNKIEVIKFTTPKEMQNFLQEADLIITHGGVATIIEGLKLGKKIIAVPRLKKYKEHVNDHQLQIIENFNSRGYIIGTKGVEEIEDALKKVKTFEPKKYESNQKEFLSKLENKINEI